MVICGSWRRRSWRSFRIILIWPVSLIRYCNVLCSYLEAEAIPDENTMISTKKSMKTGITVETVRGSIMVEERGQERARRALRLGINNPGKGRGPGPMHVTRR